MFDLRPLYAFDASEGQIPEGFASVYGPANSHANCVPASFAEALNLAGLGDIDPQLITNEVYGPNYRGGFGNFTRAIAWIQAHVANAPSFSDGPFDFAAAEAAGQAGQLVIIAGWIDAASVTFTSQTQANGFSHASLLVAHLAGEKFVIWNTWTGQMQTYDRAVLAASLYEMSIMGGLHSGGTGSLGGEDLLPDERALLDTLWRHGPYHQAPFTATLVVAANLYNHPRTNAADVVKVIPVGTQLGFDSWMWTNVSSEQGRGPDYRWHHLADGSGWVLANMCDNSPAPSIAPPDGEFDAPTGIGSNADVLAAIADLKLHPAVVNDPALAAKVDALAKHLGVGTA